MQQQLFSDDRPAPRACVVRRASYQMTLLIERHAQSLHQCLPELVEKVTNGRTCVALQLTKDEALTLEGDLRRQLRDQLRSDEKSRLTNDA